MTRGNHGQRNLVVQVKPAWARCGSTSVFSSQLNWLQESGYDVVELFISPTSLKEKPEGADWGDKVLAENPSAGNVKQRILLSPEAGKARNVEAVATRQKLYSKGINGQFVNFHCSAFEGYEQSIKSLPKAPCFVLCNHAFNMTHVRRLFPHSNVILETHDIQCLQMRRRGQIYFSDVFANNLSFEVGWWKMADYLVSLNPEENDFILDVSGRPGDYIPPPVTPYEAVKSYNTLGELFAEEGNAEDLKSVKNVDLLMVGDWHPLNVESFQWFFKSVYPLIAQKRQVTIGLVGRINERLGEVGDLPGVYKVGFLQNLANIYDFTKVFLLPDQAGTGVSIKAREALSVNACFSATPVAMRGLEIEGVSWPETPQDYANDILQLLEDEEARKKRLAVGDQLRAKLDWSNYAQQWQQAAAAIGASQD